MIQVFSLRMKIGQISTFRSPIMTSSVERKQYEWKHEEERSFISKESVAENRDTEHLIDATLTLKKVLEKYKYNLNFIITISLTNNLKNSRLGLWFLVIQRSCF